MTDLVALVVGRDDLKSVRHRPKLQKSRELQVEICEFDQRRHVHSVIAIYIQLLQRQVLDYEAPVREHQRLEVGGRRHQFFDADFVRVFRPRGSGAHRA